MRQQAPQVDSYARQLEQYSKALTSVSANAVAAIPVDETAKWQMQMFAEENVQKRCDKLLMQMELLPDAFENLDRLLETFAAANPQEALGTVFLDGTRFLRWLEENSSPTPEQLDYISCEKARFAVEAAARSQRRAHVRFQELASVAEELAGDLSDNDAMTVLVNPLRVWATLHTNALLDEDDETPAEIVFFPVGRDIHTAVLDEDGRALLRELEKIEPCSLSVWSMRSEFADRDGLIEFCTDLAQMGLAAFQ